jgi:hypothetical protein
MPCVSGSEVPGTQIAPCSGVPPSTFTLMLFGSCALTSRPPALTVPPAGLSRLEIACRNSSAPWLAFCKT